MKERHGRIGRECQNLRRCVTDIFRHLKHLFRMRIDSRNTESKFVILWTLKLPRTMNSDVRVSYYGVHHFQKRLKKFDESNIIVLLKVITNKLWKRFESYLEPDTINCCSVETLRMEDD